MKLNTTYNLIFRQYGGRINMLFLCLFIGAISFTYTEYLFKEKRYGKLPLAAMFFKLAPDSWSAASPFNTVK